MRATALFLAALAPSALYATPHAVEMELPTPSITSAWTVGDPTPRGNLIELTFAVKQQGLQELHDSLMKVSSPSSAEYGNHLSNTEVQAMTAPLPGDIQAVHDFLTEHNVKGSAATPNSDMIIAKVPIEIAESMLSTKYFQVRHGQSGVEVSRAPGGYKLPSRIAAAVDFVTPVVHLPGVHRPPVFEGADRTDIALVNSPKNLRKLYNVGDAEGKAAGNKQGITAFLNQGYSSWGLHRFWGQFCSGITCGKGEPKMVGDKTTSLFPGTESMLDIETITGVAGNIESEFWGFAGKSSDNVANEPFMKWLAEMSNTSDADVPKIFSTSYGEDENSWSYPAAQRLNVEFQKAGARGISLLYAAGDEGANCKGSKFVPEGPGSSPYVTAVGGTKGTSCWPNPGCEEAIGLGSGGFSNYWPMPDYQKTAVAAYLKNTDLPDKKLGYNTSGRAYPDISAQASNFVVWTLLPEPGVAGTSCASPTAAGVFSLLNDLRLQNGKSTLGFLNPMIYENLAAFNDITKGSNGGGSCGKGWPAKAGWDAATGVGTPDYAKLSKVVAALGERSNIVV